MDRRVPWLVFGLVVVLVVTLGSIGLALLLPGAVRDSGSRLATQRDQAGRPFSWDRERVVDPGGVLAPLGLLVLVAVPLSLLGLAVTGLIWATRAGPLAVARRRARCRSCGQEMEMDWRHCPTCGERRENIDDR